MADGTAAPTSTPAPAEIAVSDVVAHATAIIASAQAHIALVQSKPALYPLGLPKVLASMVGQLGLLTSQLQSAMPTTSGS